MNTRIVPVVAPRDDIFIPYTPLNDVIRTFRKYAKPGQVVLFRPRWTKETEKQPNPTYWILETFRCVADGSMLFMPEYIGCLTHIEKEAFCDTFAGFAQFFEETL